MLNQNKINKDIKNTNILFFTLLHPLTLIISNSIAAIIIDVNTDKELWTAISIGTAIAIPFIFFLDILRRRRINHIRDVYSSDKKSIYAYEKKRNIIVGLVSLAFIIGLIYNVLPKSLFGNDVNESNTTISSGSSDEKVKIDLNDNVALEKYIQGKWSWEKHTGEINYTRRYRFEIEGKKLKIWSCISNTNDPFDMSDGYEELNFTLGSPTRDIDGNKARYLEFAVFDKSNFFGMTYEALNPFWLVTDENWDHPVLKCGSGIPSWTRAEFKSTGTKKDHGNKSN